jgi:cell division protein FtsN
VANRDYVKRGQGSKKRPSRKNSRSKKLWKVAPIAIIAVAAFGYLLYTLSQDPEPPQPTAQAQTNTKKTKPKKAEALPPPPEEKWDYVKTLPSKEIEIKAKEQVISSIPYVMQCGAFKTLTQAENRKVNIAFQGISSKIRKKEGSSWFRVVLGPYKLKRDAERDKHKLQKVKIEPCAIWKEAQ